MAFEEFLDYDTTRPAREVLLEIAARYGIVVVDLHDSVITNAEITKIMNAERQAMLDAYPEEFAAMDWTTYQNTLERHRLKYINLLGSLSLVARASYRDILTKAAVESLKCYITYQRLDGQILDYVIYPYEYKDRREGGDLILTEAEGRGSRNFLVASIITLDLVNDSFPPWPVLPDYMTFYYDNNNLSDLVVSMIDIEATVDQGLLTFQEWLAWLPDQEFEVDGISYSFTSLWDFLYLFNNIANDLVDAIIDWGAVENQKGSGWISTVTNRHSDYLRYAQLYDAWGMGVPELEKLPVGSSLWNAIITSSRFLDAIPLLARKENEWACAMIVLAFDPSDYGVTGRPAWKWYIDEQEIGAQTQRNNLSNNPAKVIQGLENYFKDVAYRFDWQTGTWELAGLFGFS